MTAGANGPTAAQEMSSPRMRHTAHALHPVRWRPRIPANVAAAVGLRPSAVLEDTMSKDKCHVVSVKIVRSDRGNPPGKLADAELIFEAGAGPLSGLKLIGFAVWERRDGGRNVTFPARQYSVNGERRSFMLLRPMNGDPGPQEGVRDLILDAYSRVEVDA